MKYITYHKGKRVAGYSVRIWPLKEYPIIPDAFFGTFTYGGKKKALQAAIAHRNKVLKQTGQIHRLKSNMHKPYHRTNKRNSSGVIGVSYCTHFPNTKREFNTWKAYYRANGKNYTYNVRADGYDDVEAFLEACRDRYDMHGLLYVPQPENMPVTMEELKEELPKDALIFSV